MRKSILFVDDEEQILKALRRLFMETDYEIFLAGSADEALAILEKEPIDILLTDMKMPVLNGYQFLRIVKEKHPQVIKLILSGYAEKELIFKSIQENLALFYLLKPWDNEKLLLQIEKLFQIKEILNHRRLREIIESVDQYLSSTERVNHQIIDKLDNQTDTGELSKFIEEDPLLSAKILRFVRAAYNMNTGSVPKALKVLSQSDIKSIILTDEIYETVQFDPFTLFNKELILNQSKLTNQIVHYIYQNNLKKELSDQMRASGLLANIGMLVMIGAFTEEYKQILNEIHQKDRISIIDLEEERIGVTHQDIGGYLLNWWGLPYPIVETAFFHHQPLDERVMNKELLSAVNISSYIAWRIMGIDFKHCYYDSLEYLGLSKENLEDYIEEIKKGLSFS